MELQTSKLAYEKTVVKLVMVDMQRRTFMHPLMTEDCSGGVKALDYKEDYGQLTAKA